MNKPRIVLTRGVWVVKMQPMPKPTEHKRRKLWKAAHKFIYRLNMEMLKHDAESTS